MKIWDISGAGDCWSVRLDVRDLGGHLNSTYRGRAGTLAARFPPVRASCKAAGSLPLGFRATLGLLRSKCIPAALHGVEGSHVSDATLDSLRTAFVAAAWSAVFWMVQMAVNPRILMFIGPVQLCVFTGCWMLFPEAFRVMVAFTSYWLAPLRLVLSGTLMIAFGGDLVWVLCSFLLVLGKSTKTPFYRLGEIVFLLSCVKGRVFGILRRRLFWRSVQRISFLVSQSTVSSH